MDKYSIQISTIEASMKKKILVTILVIICFVSAIDVYTYFELRKIENDYKNAIFKTIPDTTNSMVYVNISGSCKEIIANQFIIKKTSAYINELIKTTPRVYVARNYRYLILGNIFWRIFGNMGFFSTFIFKSSDDPRVIQVGRFNDINALILEGVDGRFYYLEIDSSFVNKLYEISEISFKIPGDPYSYSCKS